VEILRSFYDGIKTLNRIKALAIYKRSIFLINPAFQLKFSLVISSLIVLSSLIYPFVLYDFFNEMVATNPYITSDVMEARNQLIIFLVLMQVIFILLVFILFIFMTHKIAGPMYKLKNHLSDIRQGKAITPIAFRKGDYFHDVADEVSLFLETIELNQENDYLYLEEVSLFMNNLAPIVPDDKKPVLSEISRRLLEIKLRYKQNL
jgi:sensor histidine kinase YesM